MPVYLDEGAFTKRHVYDYNSKSPRLPADLKPFIERLGQVNPSSK